MLEVTCLAKPTPPWAGDPITCAPPFCINQWTDTQNYYCDEPEVSPPSVVQTRNEFAKEFCGSSNVGDETMTGTTATGTSGAGAGAGVLLAATSSLAILWLC